MKSSKKIIISIVACALVAGCMTEPVPSTEEAIADPVAAPSDLDVDVDVDVDVAQQSIIHRRDQETAPAVGGGVIALPISCEDLWEIFDNCRTTACINNVWKLIDRYCR